MRITILQGAFLPVPPLRGGAVEKLWFELGKQFSRQGHTVCHVSRSFPGLLPEEVIEGVQHLRVRGHDTPANGVHLKLLDLLYSWRALRVLPPADILITNTFWMPILASRRQGRFGRIMVSVERMPKGQMRFYSRVAWLRVPSSAVKQAIVRETPRQANMIRTIPNALTFQPPSLQAERQPVILFCGRLHPEKGIALLIHAFGQACERGLCGWTLRLVGPVDTSVGGGGLPWLERLMVEPKRAGLAVERVAPIYNQQMLAEQYLQSAIFVYPSLAEQGDAMPNAPLEAMACGAVPIVSDLACFRDFITPGVNGLVFNHRAANAAVLLADRMLELTCQPLLLDALSQAAIAVRESHNSAVIAGEFLRCFEEPIDQRSCA